MALPKETADILFTGKEQAELRRQPLRAPAAGEILVRTTWTLISTGTETICYGRRFDAGTGWEGWVKYPFEPGYSQAGVVEAVGANVQHFKVGDRVCSTHAHCQYLLKPEKTFFPILDGVTERDATWMTLNYIVQQGVRNAEHELGEDVAVIGLGPLGQLTIQFLRLLGARQIIAIDPVPMRLEMAKAHGATHVLACKVEDALDLIKEFTRDRLCDAVYDMTGNDKVFSNALNLLRRRGRLLLIGDTGSPAAQHLTHAVIGKALRIIASHAGCNPPVDTEWAHWTKDNQIQLFFQYLKDGRMKVSDLNTHVFAPGECQAVYQKLLHDRSSTMGVHLDWSKV